MGVNGGGLYVSYSSRPFVYNLYVSSRLDGATPFLDVRYDMEDLRVKDRWGEQTWQRNEESQDNYRCGGSISPAQATGPAIETWVAYLFRESGIPDMFVPVREGKYSWRFSERIVKGFTVAGVALGILCGFAIGGLGPSGIGGAIVGAFVGYFLGAILGAAIGSF